MCDCYVESILPCMEFKEPSLYVTESGVRNMRNRARKACIVAHKEKIKCIIGVQVVTIMEFEGVHFFLSVVTHFFLVVKG